MQSIDIQSILFFIAIRKAKSHYKHIATKQEQQGEKLDTKE